MIKEKKAWEEDGFVGLSCTPCKNVFVTCREHKPKLTEQELEKAKKIVQKHHPDFEIITLNANRNLWHWYCYARKKDK